MALFRTVASVETPAQILKDYQAASAMLAPYGIIVGSQQERLERAIVITGDSREINNALEENFTQFWVKLAFDQAGIENSWTNFAVGGQTCSVINTNMPVNENRFFDGQTGGTKIAYNSCGGDDIGSSTSAAQVGYYLTT